MKLFTKDIDKKLFQQYQNGSDLDSQVAVAKIFNPYGNGRWFLLNSDPQDPNYLWAIVQMGDIVEVGSVLRSELESVRVSPFKFPLERDLGFSMVNAGELYRGLLQGKFYKKGGMVDGYARGGMVAGRFYKDNTGNELRYIGEIEGKLLFNDGEKLVTKTEGDFEEEVKENKLFGFFEEGGFVDKTEEQLKGMTDDELFEYLDAKAAYMKQYAKPLSSFKAKNYAANSAAVQFKNEGTSKLDANFPSLSKINEQATKDYQETISKKSDKMAKGGSTQNGWYEKFNAGFEDLLKKGYINDAEYKYLEKWLQNYDPLDDYGNMGGRAAAKKYVDDNRRYVEMAKGGKVKTPQEGDVVKGFGHKYLTPITEVNEKNNTFKIDSPNDWDSSGVLISFDKVVYSEDDNAWVKQMAKGGKINNWFEKPYNLRQIRNRSPFHFVLNDFDCAKNIKNKNSQVEIIKLVNNRVSQPISYVLVIKNWASVDELKNIFTECDSHIVSYGFTSDEQIDAYRKMASSIMAKGGMTEHGLRIGDKVTTDMFWDNQIVVENTKTNKRAQIDLETGKRKDEMAMGGKVKFADKVKAIKASLLKTKKVPKKEQKDYGKTYNAKEAELAAKRIAGAMAKKGMK